MKRWRVVFTRQAQRDARKLAHSGLREKTQLLLDLFAEDPLRNPPPFEKLVGDLAGALSRRINVQHRLVYEIPEREHAVKVIRMWTHYE